MYLDNIKGLASENLCYPANRPGSNILDGSSNAIVAVGHRLGKMEGAMHATGVDERGLDESIQSAEWKRKKKIEFCVMGPVSGLRWKVLSCGPMVAERIAERIVNGWRV